MVQARKTVEEKALAMLHAILARQRKEYSAVEHYEGAHWDEFRQQAQTTMARTVSAIETVESKGCPAGWAAKWGVS